MAFYKQSGTLVRGQASLTNGAPGPTTVLAADANNFTDVYSISVSTNDTALPLVTIDDGDGTVICKLYPTSGAAPGHLEIPARVIKNKTIRATASAVTAAKTVEIFITALRSPT